MPLGQLPIHILEGRDRLDAHPAEQDDHAGAAGGDEAQDEGVLAGAVVALQDGVAEGTLGMELDLVGPGPDEVVDEVGAAAEGAGGVAQPLAALDALGDGGGIVDAAVPARVRGKAGLVVRVEVVVPLVVGQLGGGVGLTVSITVVAVTVVVALFFVVTAVLVIALVVVFITTAFFFRRSCTRGCHWDSSQSISLRAGTVSTHTRQSRTTTLELLAGTKPRTKAFLLAQL